METTPMRLTFSSPIDAADAGRRIISGVVVPFNKVGHTSVGAVVFESGSIQIKDAAKIKLLAQHEPTNPIGRAIAFQTSPDAITGSFKISASQKGQDYLILASEDLIGGLSVGVDVIASKPGKDGNLYVQQAVLREVSLVESPAFREATVTQVAAAAAEDDAAEMAVEDAERNLINEISNLVDQLKLIQTVEEDLENTETTTESEAPDMTQETAANAEATSEASRETIKASAQPYSGIKVGAVRHGIDSMGRYVEHKVKAALGDETSALWVKAAEDRTLLKASDTMTSNPAFNPINYLNKFVSNTNFGRPTIDAVSRQAAPASGLQVNIPSLVTSAGGGSQVAPTVAANPMDGTAPSDTPMTSAYETVTLTRYAGQQTIDLALLERSDPIFFDQLAIQLERAYRLTTDAAMVAVLTAQGVQAAGVAGTTAGLISYIGTEAPAAYKGSSYFAENIVANTDWWSNVISAVDTTGRPLFNTTTPWNSAGDAKPTTIRGSVMGLDLYVDKNLTSGLVDESAFIIAPETAMWIESPEAFFSVNVVGSMAVQTAIYGYGAGKVLIPAGVRRFNLA